MAFFQSAFWFLILIGVMILIHELGHFWAARFFDVRVDTFSFGFGPRLFGFRRGETDYRVSAVFFLGGFVKMAGELPGDENANDPRGFLAKPRWQRLIIVLAGPLMNVVLAVALLTGLYMVKYQRVVDADKRRRHRRAWPPILQPPRPASRKATASSSWITSAIRPGTTSSLKKSKAPRAPCT